MQTTVENTAPTPTTATGIAAAAAHRATVRPAQTRAAKVKDSKAAQPPRFVKPAAAAPVVTVSADCATAPTETKQALQELVAAALLQVKPAAVPRNERVLQYDSPLDMEYLANELSNFIKHNKLSTQVQGKDFVNVEGWAYAGSRLGLMPEVTACLNLSTEAEIKYEATVVINHLATGKVVGRGFAVCSNKESGKKFYQEFAINSMAQTRATGKAYRNILAWVIRRAGYEATPAEEMDYNTLPAPAAAAPAAVVQPAAPAQPTPVVAAPAMQVLPDTGHESAVMPGTEPPVRYATSMQKEEIIRKLNHPTITRPEKTKMLLNINRLSVERAEEAISKLVQTIEDREAQQ